ncbi:MAG: amidase [Dehalococcoidia bacterium]
MNDASLAAFAREVLPEKPIAWLADAMAAGEVTARDLAQAYAWRVRTFDGTFRSVVELNPDAEAMASALDEERAAGRVRGPLHGIPVLLKDNIDTDDRMLTTAGSLAMVLSRPARDAAVVKRLRAEGAVILGKTNLSEWANFRSRSSISGWSGRGGQTGNAYRATHNPSGSSSGSGVAAALNFAAACVGTETDGSIVSPSNVNGIVGIKPTVGLTSRAGVIPISHTQDTVGPMARTVADAVALLSGLAGREPRDTATAAIPPGGDTGFEGALDRGALAGARIGVLREPYSGYHGPTDRAYEKALAALRKAGAVLVDPAVITTAGEMTESRGEIELMRYEFKRDLEAYLATRRPAAGIRPADVPGSLADIIRFNERHAADELALFGQENLEASESLPLTAGGYRKVLAANRRLAGAQGIDAVVKKHRLAALVAPTGGPAWPIAGGDRFLGGSSSPSAMAGYPMVTVPMGRAAGLPVGLSFIGRAWSERTLIGLAYAFEQVTLARRAPVLG